MYIQDAIWSTVNIEPRGEHILFITLNPRSHAAVLSVIVSIANNNL